MIEMKDFNTPPPIVSIILPEYNAGKYPVKWRWGSLKKCTFSFLFGCVGLLLYDRVTFPIRVLSPRKTVSTLQPLLVTS